MGGRMVEFQHEHARAIISMISRMKNAIRDFTVSMA